MILIPCLPLSQCRSSPVLRTSDLHTRVDLLGNLASLAGTTCRLESVPSALTGSPSSVAAASAAALQAIRLKGCWYQTQVQPP